MTSFSENKDSDPLAVNSEQKSDNSPKNSLYWSVHDFYLQEQANKPEDLVLMLKKYKIYAENILTNSPFCGHLFKRFNPNNESDLLKVLKFMAENQHTKEGWAFKVFIISDRVKKKIENKDLEGAVLDMSLLNNSRAMLLYMSLLEETTWRGYLVENFKNTLRIWQANQDNAQEEFWQTTFLENSVVLSQVLSFTVLLFKNKAYVGGQKIENDSGNLVEVLLNKNISENTALIEIKTPKTKIIGSPSEGRGFNISNEVMGSIIQVSSYKNSLLKEYQHLAAEESNQFGVFNPQCLVIAGTLQNEINNPTDRTSFELFRQGLKNVHLMTYDELFKKIQTFINLLEGNLLNLPISGNQ